MTFFWTTEIDEDKCASSPCLRGTCVSTVGGYHCICPRGYYGNRCAEGTYLAAWFVCQEALINVTTQWTTAVHVVSHLDHQYMNLSVFSLNTRCIFLSLGCGFKELGLKVPNPLRVPDEDMSASSTRGKYYAASQARVGLERKGPWQPAWCAALSDMAPYVQIYFGKLLGVWAVCVIEAEHTKTYGS